MCKIVPTILLLVALCGSQLFAQVEVTTTSGYSISGLTNTQTVDGLLFSSSAPKEIVPIGILDVATDAANVAVTATDSTRNYIELKQIGTKQWTWQAAGKIDFLVEVVDFDKRIWSKKTVSASIPDAPKPPTPTPTPGPAPGPGPSPNPDPQPEEKISGLCVLMVYESGKVGTYSAEQNTVMNSADLRVWLSVNLDSSGGLANYRCLDKDTFKNVQKCDQVWCKWLATPPPQLPWIVIGNSTKIVYQGPLPTKVDEVKQLVLKYKK